MRHPTKREVLAQIRRLERFINNWRMIPATDDPRNRVFLALLSKALTVGRAVCALVEAGFPAEAFGLSRTLIEIFLSLRYMSKDTDARVKRYVEYSARVQKEWVKLNTKYYKNDSLKLSKQIANLAEKYKSRHHWTEDSGQVRVMALEPDVYEVNESGEPITGEFDYDALYFWTSHYVHVTIHALMGHAVERGAVFRVRANTAIENRLGRLALFNALSYVMKISLQACRVMREPPPEAILQDMLKMVRRS